MLLKLNTIYFRIFYLTILKDRNQLPRGLRRRSAAARLPGFWVRIPPGAWMFVPCECCVLSDKRYLRRADYSSR
jgi:hypothetical protein